MQTINGHKQIRAFVHTLVFGKFNEATATIAAHAAWVAIRIKIDHFKIQFGMFVQQHQPISTHAKPAVADLFYLFLGKIIVPVVPVFQNNKIIARTLVLIKFYFHVLLLFDLYHMPA
jgi:hypothetical protein